jgi:hypothetical protein
MTMYKPLSPNRSDVMRAKHMYGIWYGVALGLAFSIFAWGWDAYLLSQINALAPWLKFIGGVIPCVIIGGLAGALSARLDKSFLAIVIWVTTALIFAWLTVALPLQISPRLLAMAEPGIEGLLHYEYYREFSTRIGVAFGWIMIFMFISGLLQLPLSESAVFSTSLLGKISPMLVSLLLMGIAGTIVDGLNNELLRNPVAEMDATIQFFVDNKGNDIDPQLSRRMHQGSLRAVNDLVTVDRSLIVSGYNEYLEEVDVLIKFEDAWVQCLVLYNQPTNCNQVGQAH